jgi:hypothetical protein
MRNLRMSFYETVTAAVAHFAETGFVSEQDLTDWMMRIREAALRDMTPVAVMEAELRRSLGVAYNRYVERGAIWKHHPGVPLFTKERVAPKLRGEMDRRLMAATGLIKLNREQVVTRTQQRLAGWATSIPAGGSEVVQRNPVKSNIRKALVQLPFEERRCIVDQGHKLISAVSNIIATDGGAIAVRWHDHGRHDPNYDARPEHMAKDGRIFAIKSNWAINEGLMKAGPNGYYEDGEAFGELVYCSCFGEYLYAIRRLPDDMLTQKGRDLLKAPK